jgi:tRNA dimethylallyltransferase
MVMALAAHQQLTVMSADSRQIYRGLDIGTSKPTMREQERVPHRGIDLIGPTERFSAAAWALAAQSWIAAAQQHGSVPVVVGGTGFYIRSLVHPLADAPPLDASRRDLLRAHLATVPADELRRWCEHLDPGRAHLGRAQLSRAVEFALLAGQRLSAIHVASVPRSSVRARYLLVDPGPALADRIVTRVDAMLAAGWLDEVHRLTHVVPEAAPAWDATGYRELRDVVRGADSLSRARELIIIRTKQYAKRQRTWFRHQLAGEAITIVSSTDGPAVALAMDWWRAEGTV